MNAYIVPKLTKPETPRILEEVSERLVRLGIGAAKSLEDCDIVITIGGDGTILENGKKAASAGKPLLGINTGFLGFMATLETNELPNLEKLVGGDYRISRRMLLDVKLGGQTVRALNDVVLHRGAKAKLPEFAVSRMSGNRAEVLRIRADGIIISTPTGSTAYSLSAGGPIIEPELELIELTALCPHTLFNRPMIFSDEGSIRVCFNGGDVSVSVDGRDFGASEADSVEISKSDLHLDLIDIDGNSFYSSVHNKLMKPLK